MKTQFRLIAACMAALTVAISCDQKEKTVPVEGVSLSAPSLILFTGEQASLTATVRPADATDKSVTWFSSNTSVATVEGGIVSGISEGSATITVTAQGGFSDAALVSVLARHVTGLSVSPEGPVTLKKGETLQFTAAVEPANADNPAIEWLSSNPEVLSVDANGLATALAGGSAMVSAKSQDSGKEAAVEVTVIVPVTGVSLSESELTLTVNNPYTGLYATVTPEDATNRNLLWEVSDKELLTLGENADGSVSLTGRFEADGWVSVTSEDGNFSAICAVYVRDIHAESVAIDGGDFTLETYGMRQLKAVVSPEEAVNASVVWTSSDTSVATVSESGLVTGVKAGSARITVATVDGGFTDTVTVTVQDVPVSSLSITQGAEATITRDQTLQLSVVIGPENATHKEVVWSSSVPEVASVSADGLVKGLAKGVTTVTVTTADGTRSASIKITVNVPSTDIGTGGDFGEEDYGKYE